jgi:hypothetical protein
MEELTHYPGSHAGISGLMEEPTHYSRPVYYIISICVPFHACHLLHVSRLLYLGYKVLFFLIR